jgi:hypothetical protein
MKALATHAVDGASVTRGLMLPPPGSFGSGWRIPHSGVAVGDALVSVDGETRRAPWDRPPLRALPKYRRYHCAMASYDDGPHTCAREQETSRPQQASPSGRDGEAPRCGMGEFR